MVSKEKCTLTVTEEQVNEAVELLEEGIEVTLEVNGYSYNIGPADNFIGGEGREGFISEVLGNVLYTSAKYILTESLKHFEGQDVELHW